MSNNMKKRKLSLKNDANLIKKKISVAADDFASENLKEHRPDQQVEDEDDDVEAPKTDVTHGYHLVRGKMGHGMEDYIVVEQRRINGHDLGLYAIFDGHSGCFVAEYLQSHLFNNILNQPDFWTNPKRAIRRAYKATNNEILENVAGRRGGSTAVTAILIDREKLIVANVGDSRAILCEHNKVKQITVYHEPRRRKNLLRAEVDLCQKCLLHIGNVPRVDGQLAMTRAFRDGKIEGPCYFKTSFEDSNNQDTKFIILASDGLWKVISNEDAFDCIRELKNAQQESEQLIKEALATESKDNISSIVVTFN